MAAASPLGELGAAQQIISFLKAHGADLDGHLSPAQRAEAYAYGLVISAALDPATTYTTWVEGAGFAEYRKVARLLRPAAPARRAPSGLWPARAAAASPPPTRRAAAH
jgi:hypothetical protein